MKIKCLLAFVMLLGILSVGAQSYEYATDFIPFEVELDYEDKHKEEIKAVKKEWDAKNVRPVFDIYRNNALLGYIIKTSGKKLQKKDPSYNGPMKDVEGFIDAEGKIVVPFGKYAGLNFYKNDVDKYIWLRAFAPDKDLRFGVLALDGTEIIPPLYRKIEYSPSSSSQKSKADAKYSTSSLYIAGQKHGPSFDAYSDFTSSSGNVSVYGLDGSLRMSHLPSLGFANLGKYIVADLDVSLRTSSLDKLRSWEGMSTPSMDYAVCFDGGKLGLYYPDGKQILPNEYRRIEIMASKDELPSKLDGLCYVERDISGDKTCGIYDIENEKWAIPVNFSKIKLDKDKDGINWIVWRDELSEAESYNPENDYKDRYIDEGTKLYNAGRYADAVNYYAANGIETPMAKVYSAFALLKIVTENFYNMVNDISAVEYCMQSNSLWTQPITRFDFDTCEDYLNMALASASDYMISYDRGLMSDSESRYHNQIESLQQDVDYYKSELAHYRPRYAKAVNYVGNSIRTVNAQQQAMQQAYINAFANMFSSLTSALGSSGSNKSASTTMPVSSGNVSRAGNSSGSSVSSSSNDGPSVEWKKNRIRELMKQHDYYMKVVEREEARPEKSTAAINLIQSSKRHLEEIDEEIRKWSN